LILSYLAGHRTTSLDHRNLEAYNVSLMSRDDRRSATYHVSVARGGNMLDQLSTSQLEY